MLVAPFHASHSHTFPRVTGMYTILLDNCPLLKYFYMLVRATHEALSFDKACSKCGTQRIIRAEHAMDP